MDLGWKISNSYSTQSPLRVHSDVLFQSSSSGAHGSVQRYKVEVKQECHCKCGHVAYLIAFCWYILMHTLLTTIGLTSTIYNAQILCSCCHTLWWCGMPTQLTRLLQCSCGSPIGWGVTLRLQLNGGKHMIYYTNSRDPAVVRAAGCDVHVVTMFS